MDTVTTVCPARSRISLRVSSNDLSLPEHRTTATKYLLSENRMVECLTGFVKGIIPQNSPDTLMLFPARGALIVGKRENNDLQTRSDVLVQICLEHQATRQHFEVISCAPIRHERRLTLKLKKSNTSTVEHSAWTKFIHSIPGRNRRQVTKEVISFPRGPGVLARQIFGIPMRMGKKRRRSGSLRCWNSLTTIRVRIYCRIQQPKRMRRSPES